MLVVICVLEPSSDWWRLLSSGNSSYFRNPVLVKRLHKCNSMFGLCRSLRFAGYQECTQPYVCCDTDKLVVNYTFNGTDLVVATNVAANMLHGKSLSCQG